MKLIKNATIVNEGRIFKGSVLIKGTFIEDIFETEIPESLLKNAEITEAENLLLIPGVIDDQVHFREPGLTHKADIFSESCAAVAGGITSFMEMPNTKPQTITQNLLADKFKTAADSSVANYSFYIGATNDNIDELIATDRKNVCGVKVFMGSSTGNMLVDNPDTLNSIFSKCRSLIAVHCEDEATIQANIAAHRNKFGEDVPMKYHPAIRSAEACYKSSSLAVSLAKKYDSRLHVLHLSTAAELELFNNEIPLIQKNITAEVCVHHLWFCDEDYDKFGAAIKWNPAVKARSDRDALLEALKSNLIDVVATDHAPHLPEEKFTSYFNSASGGPLVQHSLVAMLQLYAMKKISLEQIVEKMCHAPAELFRVHKRGYIRKGYFADFVLVNLNNEWTVSKNNILYKCGWSPFENMSFASKVEKTFVNGNVVYENERVASGVKGMALQFE